MTLFGITEIESESGWAEITSDFFGGVYLQLYSGTLSDVDVDVSMTDWAPTSAGTTNGGRGRRRGLSDGGDGTGERSLQSEEDAAVIVTYDQKTRYIANDPNWEPDDDFFFVPLSAVTRRDEYVGMLKSLSGYTDLTEVSEISVSSSDVNGGNGGDGSGGDGFWTTGAIVGIAIGGAAVLFAAIIAGVVRYNRGLYDDDVDDNDRPPEVLEYHHASQQDSSRTWTAPNSLGGGDRSSSLPSSVNEFSYENQTVGTMDYDYAAAYGGIGGGADHSLSDAGGTIGSRTRQTGADGMEEDMPTMVPPGSGNTVFSEDPTFDQVYEDVREIILDVYAPAGKLGVVIDTPNDGAPMIHAVKDTSPIFDRVRVGDKLVAVDDEDVRAMTAMKVSKLISKKGNQASRKLTIIRQERKA
ncbi:hypothetical protein ACHAW5_000188 [Stephanodiscus triporus]|uniref:PDZ domain-containing protein n=1 Tax=Stephanodiscus triporus TaxID=2934178 RepID=A0ABD3NPD0_9STRA